jgi:glutathione S-transferase
VVPGLAPCARTPDRARPRLRRPPGAVERDQRTALLEATGADTIPTLLLENGTAVVGEDAIEAYLDERFDEPAEAEAHRLKAAKIRRRYLEDECECLQPATR